MKKRYSKYSKLEKNARWLENKQTKNFPNVADGDDEAPTGAREEEREPNIFLGVGGLISNTMLPRVLRCDRPTSTNCFVLYLPPCMMN